ncbi:hypothetical protein, partial [uncultured Jannaschia sp.]|uniref:hypothetical protein n=1 Tax=uncultured Jannaschia sp. TaxID=293347 RepID=UPI002621F3F6
MIWRASITVDIPIDLLAVRDRRVTKCGTGICRYYCAALGTTDVTANAQLDIPIWGQQANFPNGMANGSFVRT